MQDLPQYTQDTQSVILSEEITQLKKEVIAQQQDIAESNKVFDHLRQIQQYKPFVNTTQVQNMQLQQVHTQIRTQSIDLLDKLITQTQQHQNIISHIEESIDKHLQIIDQIEKKQAQFGREQTIQQIVDLTDMIQKGDKQIGTMINNVQHQIYTQEKHIYAVKQAAQIIQIAPIDPTEQVITPQRYVISQPRPIYKSQGTIDQIIHEMGVKTYQEEIQDRLRPMRIQMPKRQKEFKQEEQQYDQPQKKLKRQTKSYLDALFG